MDFSKETYLQFSSFFSLCVVFALICFAAQAQVPTQIQTKPTGGLTEARILYAEGEYARAIEALTALQETVSAASAAETFRLLGLSRYALGEYSLAATALRRAFAADSSSLQILHALGRVEKTLGDVEGARKALERAFAIDSANRTTLELYATLCADEERFADAAATLERLLALEPRNAGARLNLARAYAELFSGGAREFGARAKDNYLLSLDLLPLNRQIRLEAARFFAGANDFLGALIILDRGLKAFPDDPTLWRRKAAAHNRLNQPREAAFSYERAIALGDSLPANFRELGVMYCQLQRFDSARAALLIATEFDAERDNPRATSFLALAFRKLGDFDNALKWYDATLSALQRPQFAGMLAQTAFTHRAAKANEKAREYYQLALDVDTANVEARYELATLFDEAAQETLKTDARKSAQHRRLAVVYYKRFLAGLTNDSLPTAQHAVRRLREFGETPPNFDEIRRQTPVSPIPQTPPRADSSATVADSAFDSSDKRIRFFHTSGDSTARATQPDTAQALPGATKTDTTAHKSGDR
jgi:tetratricopeptide (TPR) repeat protein